MEEFISSVSPKGQITLPAEVRRQLGIKPKDKVSLRLEGDTVRVRPATFTLVQVFGSVEPATRTEDFDAVERSAQEERAAQEGMRLSQG